MEYLNLIPLALLAWVFFKALRDGLVKDPTDRYFTVNKGKTGARFCNLFGIPRP